MPLSFLGSLKAEFETAKLKLNWNSSEDFRESRWKFMSKKKLLAARWMLALYFLILLCLSLALGYTSFWIFALTSINYLIMTLYFVYAAILLSYNHRVVGDSLQPESTNHDIAFSLKVQWLLYNLSLNICVFVNLAFWTMLAPSRPGGFGPSMKNFLVIDRHGINLLLLIIEFLLNRIPVRVLHFIYPSLAVGAYFIYNGIYWSISKNLIYGKILDYGSHSGLATGLALGAVFVLTPLIQLGWFSANYLKKKSFVKRNTDANANCESVAVEL